MRPPTVVARWSGFLNSWHVIAGRPVRQRFGCYALPCRYALFARPEVTLEDLERRLVQLVEGNDSVRLAQATHPGAVHVADNDHLTWSWPPSFRSRFVR